MARTPRAASAPKRVDALKHKSTRRKNIPTQENSSFMHEEDAAPVRLEFARRYSPATHPELYKRNADLDPQLAWRGNDRGEGDVQLVWKGKDEEDAKPLTVEAAPIYIQEKVHPKAIIDDIRRRQKGMEDWKYENDAPDLFADFNGIPDIEDKLCYYEHDSVGLKWSNRLILGDSLSVMASLAEKEGLRGKVQMIYLDPPYGIKFNSNWQVSTRDRDVKDGKREGMSREPEVVRAFRDTWAMGVHSYLNYLRDRIRLAAELLAESGSFFFQIGDENVHLARNILDEVFGGDNFVAVIAFAKTSGSTREYLAGTFDYLIWYGKDRSRMKYRQLYRAKEFGGQGASGYSYVEEDVGLVRPLTTCERDNPEQIKGRLLTRDNLMSQSLGREKGEGAASWFTVRFEGSEFRPTDKARWKTNEAGMGHLQRANRLAAAGNTLRYVRYLNDFAAFPVSDMWTDTTVAGFAADKRYIVETAPKIVERCLLMTTDPGDLVIDPTCGSGTTAYVAEQWGRRWITIDTSRVALTLARTRLMSARYPHYLLKDSAEGAGKEAELSQRPAIDGPFTHNIAHGFVYKRVPHVTLKSIANNAEIDVIWDKHQPGVDKLRADLNTAIQLYVDTLPKSERPKWSPWEEWRVPRPPVFPWDEKCQKLHARILDLKAERAELEDDEDATDEILAKHNKKFGKPLKDLNTLLGRKYTLDTLPEHAGDPLPAAALPLHEAFWTARRARQGEIDASIARNAETEFLYDQPYEDKGTVRVAGPFTVESLSPHRVLSATDDDPALLASIRSDDTDDHRITAARKEAAQKSARQESDDFVRVVLANLETAGVGNTKKGERLRFTKGSMRPASGRYINAKAEYQEHDSEDAPVRKAAIFIGPEYGTVSRQMIVAAAKEAVDVYDILIVCGFAFEAHATGDTINTIGSLPILRVNMNQDLRMADRLKAADQGNLFVVFGEPDIDFRKSKDGRYEVEIKGLDIFNPNTGELKPSGPDDIACWFLDTDYDEGSFFVRHAYFLGGKDPYEKLQKALKAEINEEAWETLHSAVSFPFKSSTGKIAVKAINHYGDEVLKVFDVSEAREA
ncbi:MAG: site-specific DNA-methyltransferase [Hyphomicrobium sp.]|nr:site-specific DNA-methyltransferase [Hyphomicrobium sp.]